MTNQEILQQVYDSIKGPFSMATFYHEVRLVRNIDFQEAVSFYNKLLLKPTNTPIVEKRSVITSYDLEHMLIDLAFSQFFTKEQFEVKFPQYESVKLLNILRRFGLILLVNNIDYMCVTYFKEIDYTNLADKITFALNKPVEPKLIEIMQLSMDEFNRLQDIERKYNQLMKSFKEVEG